MRHLGGLRSWFCSPHFLGSGVQREILPRGLLLELEQELVQMCLADHYEKNQQFQSMVIFWCPARQSCNCGGRLQIKLHLVKMVNPEHLGVT